MPLTYEVARHFLSRTGFGGTPGEICRFMTLDEQIAVAETLAISTNKARTPPPAWIHRLPRLPRPRKQWNWSWPECKVWAIPGRTGGGGSAGEGRCRSVKWGKARTIALHQPARFMHQVGLVKPANFSTTNRALAHILDVRREISQAAWS